jgi:hypothetical protein
MPKAKQLLTIFDKHSHLEYVGIKIASNDTHMNSNIENSMKFGEFNLETKFVYATVFFEEKLRFTSLLVTPTLLLYVTPTLQNFAPCFVVLARNKRL